MTTEYLRLMGDAGAFGFVQLAKNKINGQLVAIKFLERGPDKVCSGCENFVTWEGNFPKISLEDRSTLI